MSGVVNYIPHMRLSSNSAKVSKKLSNISNSMSRDLVNKQFSVKTIEISTARGGPWSLLPTGDVQAADFFENNIFDASVEPDLPTVAKLMEMFEPKKPEAVTEPFSKSSYEKSLALSNFQIKTVAAQTKSLAEVSKLVCERGNKEKTGALLLVSGGHPLRRFPILNSLMPTNSETMIRRAIDLRTTQMIPQRVQIWAVENPLVNPVSRLERKIEAGAEAIITQPPLLPDTFQKWWDKMDTLGLQKETPIVVGVPVISSSSNFSFWLYLTGAMGKGSEAQRVLQDLQQREKAFKDGKQLFWREYNSNLIKRVKQLPGVSGVHVMPVTSRGWKELPFLIQHLQ